MSNKIEIISGQLPSTIERRRMEVVEFCLDRWLTMQTCAVRGRLTYQLREKDAMIYARLSYPVASLYEW